jgi:hypothetical protein
MSHFLIPTCTMLGGVCVLHSYNCAGTALTACTEMAGLAMAAHSDLKLKKNQVANQRKG